MDCPNCKKSVEYIPGTSEFCSECGADLQAAAEEIRTTRSRRSDDIGWNDLLAVCGREKASASAREASQLPRDDWDLSAVSKKMADILETADDDFFIPEAQSSAAPLKLEYNRNIFFISGSQSVIKLRITPVDHHLNNILVFMVSQRDGDLFRRQIPVTEMLQPGKTFSLSIPFNPEKCSGNISITFYVGCQSGHTVKYYQFTVEHVVYDPHQSSAALSSQIVINQRFDAQQAADINYRDNLGDAVRELAGKNLTANELISRLNDLPPIFQMQTLAESTWRPEDILVHGDLYHSDKLMLEWNGFSILLLARQQLVLGRNSDSSDLIIRTGGGKLSPQDYPNRTVSRKHAELIYKHDHVELFDHSSYGTYVNGQLPGDEGITLPETALVEFGDIHWELTLQKCGFRSARNICQTCRCDKIKSAVFKRKDQEKECYLIVWQCCELGRIFEQLADWDIFYRNNAFFIRTPEQDFFYLRPGHSIESCNQKINVKYFQQ